MKTVVVYGDSNTFGQTNWPILGEARYPYAQRWTSIVQKRFKDDARVIAEGLGGRTAANLQTADDRYRNGREHFRAIYNSHEPVDILIITLGTNDCQTRYDCTPEQIVEDLWWYAEAAKSMHYYEDVPNPRVVFVTPPKFKVTATDKYLYGRPRIRNEVVKLMKAHPDMELIEINEVELSQDGVHLSREGHKSYAKIVIKKLKEML